MDIIRINPEAPSNINQINPYENTVRVLATELLEVILYSC